jgi:deoxyribose-phosphate aldolase
VAPRVASLRGKFVVAENLLLEATTDFVTVRELAKMIDHSLLHPTMTDAQVAEGCRLARRYDVATACVKPYAIGLAREILAGSAIGVCPVIAFPHGNSSTAIKVKEAEAAAQAGGSEIDAVINVGKALGGQWDYVGDEIRAINEAVVSNGAILKVIFENDYLEDAHIVRLCEICSEIRVAFVKTSTGYGFVKQPDGSYNYKGATDHHLRLMREHCPPSVQIKAAGGVRTLDDLLRVRSLGVSRVGATATEAILEAAKRRFSEVAGGR